MTTQIVTENTRYLQKLGRWRDGTLSHHWMTLEVVSMNEGILIYRLVGGEGVFISEPLQDLLDREFLPVPPLTLPEQFKTGIYADKVEDETETEITEFDQWLAENYEEAGSDASNGELWYLSKKPTEFMPISLSKLREQWEKDNPTEDNKEYHLVVVDNVTGETIYHRELVGEDSLDIVDYLPEIQDNTGISLAFSPMFPGCGQIGITIGFSATPENDTCVWDTEDYYLA